MTVAGILSAPSGGDDLEPRTAFQGAASRPAGLPGAAPSSFAATRPIGSAPASAPPPPPPRGSDDRGAEARRRPPLVGGVQVGVGPRSRCGDWPCGTNARGRAVPFRRKSRLVRRRACRAAARGRDPARARLRVLADALAAAAGGELAYADEGRLAGSGPPDAPCFKPVFSPMLRFAGRAARPHAGLAARGRRRGRSGPPTCRSGRRFERHDARPRARPIPTASHTVVGNSKPCRRTGPRRPAR